MPIFKGQTDKVLKIKLQSHILDCFWGFTTVAMGGSIPMEVRTAYVGDGSNIEITVKDLNGGAVDTIKGKVYSNYFRAKYKVNRNKTGGLFFEAVMKDHGISIKSGKLAVLPPVSISNFKWEDGEGQSLTEITRQEQIKLSASIIGAPDGSEAYINLYVKDEENNENFVDSFPVKVETGKVECIWAQKYPYAEEDKKVQQDLNKTGENYYTPSYLFEVQCLGVSGKSSTIEYCSWAEFNFGDNAKGTVVFTNPDGTEQSEKIPADGVVKLKKPKVGNIEIKEIKL